MSVAQGWLKELYTFITESCTLLRMTYSNRTVTNSTNLPINFNKMSVKSVTKTNLEGAFSKIYSSKLVAMFLIVNATALYQ